MSSNTVSNYGWASTEGPQSCGYITPRVLDELATLKVKRVLDLGSGNGSLCGHMAAHGFDVCGVDYDQAGIDLSRQIHPGVRFHRFGVQDDPAELLALESPFEAVVSTEVIEHLYSPHLLPAFARAVLAPGGKLVITTPYHGYLKNLALALTDKWDHHHTALWHGGHIKFWSRKTITALLESQGFQVERFGGVGRLPYLWKSMVVVAIRQP
jgi:2-polyprenyl-3-methyl-5-hydroxy-6-metoxy-1,4-benzoquinol methylase